MAAKKFYACLLLVLVLFAGVTSARPHHHRSSRRSPPPPHPASPPPHQVSPPPPHQASPPPPHPASPPPPPPKSHQVVFNVMDYKAHGDGVNDDTKAFTSAWAAACQVPNSVVYMPASRSFLISQTTLQGPCQPNMVLQLDGTVVAPADPKHFQNLDTWLLFQSLQGFTVRGNGMIDGRGAAWWKLSCKKNNSPSCNQRAPTAVKFFKCQDLTVKDIKIQNSQQMNLAFLNSQRVLVTNVNIHAPEDSPNTDGIHIEQCQRVTIDHASIGVGDDCVSIGSGSSEIYVQHSSCGPGHGISIGSLGKDKSVAYVKNIYVKDVTLTGTTNGLRIKTWQGGKGSASSIRFEDVRMTNVYNPIIIDQFYCDSTKECKSQTDAVQVSDVTYSNIVGTSASQDVTTFKCSAAHPCYGLSLDRINLSQAQTGKPSTVSCTNAYGNSQSSVVPRSCLVKPQRKLGPVPH